jgi:hypothetical protein
LPVLRICKHGTPAPKGGCDRCRAERNAKQEAGRKAKGRRTGSNQAQRHRILKRDGFRCTFADHHQGRCPTTRKLEVHHLYGQGDDRDDSLVTLCTTHHLILEGRTRRQ